VGSFATFVNIITRYLLSEYVILQYYISITIAYLIGMLLSFTFNKIITFEKGKRRQYQEARTFVIIALIGLILTNIFSYLFVVIIQYLIGDKLNQSSIRTFSHILSLSFVSIYGFLGHKYITFRGGIREFITKFNDRSINSIQ